MAQQVNPKDLEVDFRVGLIEHLDSGKLDMKKVRQMGITDTMVTEWRYDLRDIVGAGAQQELQSVGEQTVEQVVGQLQLMAKQLDFVSAMLLSGLNRRRN